MKTCWSLLGLVLALSLTAQAQAQLLIHSARWQADNGASCDASAKLRQACNGERHCRLPAEREAMCRRDPAWGQAKTLYVSYSCDGVRQADKSFPDGRRISLRCNDHRDEEVNLHINWARWVGEGRGSCDASAKISAACEGHDVCNIFATSANACGYDPARGMRKHLDINYRCGNRPSNLLSFDEGELATLRCNQAYPNADDDNRSLPNQANDQVFRDEDNPDSELVGKAIVGAIVGAILDGMNDHDNNDDEGWRKDGQPRLNHSTNQLQIHNARWEVVGGGPWCDATPQFGRACNGRGQCQLGVNQYSLCADPAPDRSKRVNVKYSCDGRIQPMASFQDGKQAILRCPGSAQTGNHLPAPVRPNYPPVQPVVPVQPSRPSRPDNVGGPVRPVAPVAPVSPNRPSWPTSVERPYPNNPAPSAVTQSNSGEPLAITRARLQAGNGAGCDATPKVAIACNGKRSCQVAAQVQTLCSGDPAPGQAKTLEINYLCHGRPQAKQSFAEGAQAVLRCD